jgi:hypothetical protein
MFDVQFFRAQGSDRRGDQPQLCGAGIVEYLRKTGHGKSKREILEKLG